MRVTKKINDQETFKSTNGMISPMKLAYKNCNLNVNSLHIGSANK